MNKPASYENHGELANAARAARQLKTVGLDDFLATETWSTAPRSARSANVKGWLKVTASRELMLSTDEELLA